MTPCPSHPCSFCPSVSSLVFNSNAPVSFPTPLFFPSLSYFAANFISVISRSSSRLPVILSFPLHLFPYPQPRLCPPRTARTHSPSLAALTFSGRHISATSTQSSEPAARQTRKTGTPTETALYRPDGFGQAQLVNVVQPAWAVDVVCFPAAVRVCRYLRSPGGCSKEAAQYFAVRGRHVDC